LNVKNKQLNLNDYKGNLILLNFWATWCAPCKEEMPSLDLLQSNESLNNLKIFPINVGQDNIEKASNFFKDMEIKNLELYFDSPITLAKKFSLRGIPTSILFNKEGEEFARIIGSINFEDKKFIEWLSNYN
jgi:thiol-disulfide isomerase/thioredoxin